MCVARVGRVVELLPEARAAVDVDGARAEVSLVVLTLEGAAVEPGTWLLLHTGMAVAVLDPRDAEQTAGLLRMVEHANPSATTGAP